MKHIRKKKFGTKNQMPKERAPKGFYIERGNDSLNFPLEDDRMTVSRFINKASTGGTRSVRELRESQLQDWPYQGDEGDDFLFGKIPDFFPDNFEEEE